MSDYDLILPNGKTPTFLRSSSSITSTSTLDLALASPHLAPLCETKVESDTFGSDHFPVITTIGIQASLRSKFQYKLPLSKKLCQALHHELLSSVGNLPQQVSYDIISYYNRFTKNLLDAARSFLLKGKRLPHTSTKIKKLELAPWWNESCSEAVHSKKKVIRKFISMPTEKNHLNLRKARKDCSEKLSKQKRKGWHNLVNSFNNKTPTSQIWTLIKCFKRKASQHCCSSQDAMQTSMEAISKLCPPSSYYDCSKSLTDMKAEDNQSSNTCTWLDDSLILKKFRSVLVSSRKNSAPGLDQISYEMLEQLPVEYETCLLFIFNEIFSQGIFPNSWKTSLVIFIRKPGSKAVRPISLMSWICKLERILYQRLSWFVESRPILPQAQAGFRLFRVTIIWLP